jgi:hypothetical protein
LKTFSPKESVMSQAKLIALCTVLLLGCLPVAAQSETPTPDTNAQTKSTLASSEQVSRVEARMNDYFQDYKTYQWTYSWAYHICIYGAAILSALAALLTKVHIKAFGLQDPTRRDNSTASLAAIAALLVAVSTAGKLQESWQTNKTKRYAVESLLNQLTTDQNLTSDDLEAYGKRLSLIIDPNTAIVESKTVSPTK